MLLILSNFGLVTSTILFPSAFQVFPGVFALPLTASGKTCSMENTLPSRSVISNSRDGELSAISQWYSHMYPGSVQKRFQGDIFGGFELELDSAKNICIHSAKLGLQQPAPALPGILALQALKKQE